MVRVAIGFLILCALVTAVNAARADGLFQETITLRNGQLLVVEESSLEPRSIGSYNLRLYSGENPEFPYDRFIAGVVHERDGVIESASELEPGKCEDCVMVCLRSVGTGNTATWHVYNYGNNRLWLQTKGASAGSDPACGDFGNFRERFSGSDQ